jgi:hypothetical protein
MAAQQHAAGCRQRIIEPLGEPALDPGYFPAQGKKAVLRHGG